MSRLSADGLLLITAFLWGVTFVAQKYADGDHAGARLRRRAFCCFGRGACAVRALGISSQAACPEPRRMAARARDRPHALLRHDPAAGGDRDDQRHQRRLPNRLLCRADPFRRLGADRSASARDHRRRGLRIARRRLAARLGRGARSSEYRRRARAPRRFRLGDGHRADADLPCPLRPAAAACLRAICGLRRPGRAVFRPVRIDPAWSARRDRCRRSCSPALSRARSPIRSRSSPRRIRRPPRRRSFSPSRACSLRSRAPSCSASV